MTESKAGGAHEDERARVNALKRAARATREALELQQRRLEPLGPGPQFPTEMGCMCDGAPVVGSPEWRLAA